MLWPPPTVWTHQLPATGISQKTNLSVLLRKTAQIRNASAHRSKSSAKEDKYLSSSQSFVSEDSWSSPALLSSWVLSLERRAKELRRERVSQVATKLKGNGRHYFVQCCRERHRQHTGAKIDVSPPPSAHRLYFSVRNRPPRESPVGACLEEHPQRKWPKPLSTQTSQLCE